ncbi:lipid A-modifier LpxR family protein [Candidatus Neomarinimicrobiota bacterium]
MVKCNFQIILFLFLLAIPKIGNAQDKNDSHQNKLGIILINDTLFETDKDYTGSLGIYYKFKLYPLSIKYQIDAYTPNTKYKALTEPKEGMHPYAGFGFIGTEYKILNNNFLLSLRMQLGSTGKNSYAKELQDMIHNILDQSTFGGWDSQIQTKFGYVFNPQLEYIFNIKYFTLLPAISVKYGNLISMQTFDVQFLSGINYNKDFLFTIYSNKPNYNIFISYAISNVTKNVFLTGFEGYEYGVVITSTVVELKFGIDIKYKSYGFEFQNHYRSKEYSSQKSNGKFSTLILYYLF